MHTSFILILSSLRGISFILIVTSISLFKRNNLVRWPTTVTAKINTSRQKKITHGKKKKTHGKKETLAAKRKTSRRKEKDSRQKEKDSR